MNTQSNSIKFVVIFLALSFLVAAFGNVFAGQATNQDGDISSLSQPEAVVPGNKVALKALTGQSNGKTVTLTKVYQQADSSSLVVYVLPPSREVNIIGRSEDGTWYAVAGDEKEQQAGGWIASGDLSVAKVNAEVRSLAKVYQQADSSSQVVNILTPTRQVEVLGRVEGTNWLAIRNKITGQNSIAFVSRTDIKINREPVQTYGMAKAYLSPNQSNYVIDILVPNQKVAVIGRSADGRWLAVENADNGQFRGWVLAGDIRGAGDTTDVPVIPLQ